jgi:protein gp37
MGESTAIAWTDHTFNPWWGCTKIEGPNGTGSACDHCYAATFAKRTGHDVWGKDGERRFFGDKHWNEPLRWENERPRARAQHRASDHLVFCASMADVFEARDDLDEPGRAVGR